MDTFEKKSREASVEPPDFPTTTTQSYSQAQKLSEAAARGLEGDELEGGVSAEGGDLDDPEAELSSDNESDIV